MENKLVTKKFISDYSPCLFGTGEESTMFHNEKYLLKFIKSEYLKDDREQIIKRLEELSHPNIVIPEFLLHDRKSFLGYGMIYYSDYTSLDKIVSDTTRLRIIEYLFDGKKCVNEISDNLKVSQSAISHQLKSLRQSDLVKTEKIGKLVYYELKDDHIKKIFESGLEHIKERL